MRRETQQIWNAELTTASEATPVLSDDITVLCEDGHLVVRGSQGEKIPWPDGVHLVLPNTRHKLLSYFSR